MNSRPSCPECGSNNVYVRVSGELVCRRCGYVGSVGESESDDSAEEEDEEKNELDELLREEFGL